MTYGSGVKCVREPERVEYLRRAGSLMPEAKSWYFLIDASAGGKSLLKKKISAIRKCETRDAKNELRVLKSGTKRRRKMSFCGVDIYWIAVRRAMCAQA